MGRKNAHRVFSALGARSTPFTRVDGVMIEAKVVIFLEL
jgi:hypothetical protein